MSKELRGNVRDNVLHKMCGHKKLGVNPMPARDRRRVQPDPPEDLELEWLWTLADEDRCDDPTCHCNTARRR